MVADKTNGIFFGKVLHRRNFHVELVTATVVSVKVFTVNCNPGRYRQLPSGVWIQVGEGNRCIKAPTVKAGIRE